MKKLIVLFVAIAALFFAGVVSAYADGRGHGPVYSQGRHGGGPAYGHAPVPYRYGYGGGPYRYGYARTGYYYGHGPYYGYGPYYGHGGFSGSIYIGPGWWGYPYPYPYYYPYYASPPVVIQQQPTYEYEQQAPAQEQTYYWYFCPDSNNYYPYVKQCPGGWQKVAPKPPDKGRE